jgi:phytoene dehydrogenase-like protein
MSSVYDAVIIGAGHNGLIAACYLAKAGKRVLVLERADHVGGACVTREVWPGYRVSEGAYLCSLLLPEIIDDLRLRDYGFEVYRRDTSGYSPFLDGSNLFLYPDEERTRKALEEFLPGNPEDVAAYFEFEADVEAAANIVEPFLTEDAPSSEALLQAFCSAGCEHLYSQFITGSVRDLLDARFKDDRLKTVLATDGLIGTYGGPSTPGTAYVLLHHYIGRATGSRGSWGYVRGGMGNITQGLAQALTGLGGEIRLSSAVASIQIEPDAITGKPVTTGVCLESGEMIPAEAVLSNADPYRTFGQFVPAAYRPTNETWNLLKSQGGASAKINLAVSELPRFTNLPYSDEAIRKEHFGTVHLCPSVQALETAWDEASRGIPATEPMIEMYIQTATDSTLTPEGCHILSLFVQYFPYNLAEGLDLEIERERFADRVIEICARYAPNVPGAILHRQVLTPRDLEARFGLTGGHIFHGDLLPPTLFVGRNVGARPGGRTDVKGLYLCGSGAHPGGCVYGAPGKLAAEAFIADYLLCS